MKRFFVCLFVVIYFSLFQCTFASSSHCHHANHSSHHHNHNHQYHSSSGSSQPIYLVKTENNEQDEKFFECEKHYAKKKTITDYYSDGSKRIYVNYTVYNKDGSIITTNCNRIKHILHKKEHYFIACKNSGGCSIIDSKGNAVTNKNYSFIEELKQNRYLVKLNKKYGIIDIKENTIVPIKYQKFQKISNNIFITKLNGYFGILDIENNILVKNNCEKIKLLNNSIIIKRYNKYGLSDLNGKMLIDIEFDNIKNKGEYIIIKKDNKYQILDDKGNLFTDLKFEKIKYKRNTLYGYKNKNWSEIS